MLRARSDFTSSPSRSEQPSRQNKAAFSGELLFPKHHTAHRFQAIFFFFSLKTEMFRDGSPGCVSSVLCVSSWHTPTVCGIDILGRFVMCCTCISFCSCLSPEEPDRVLCGCGRQQHAPALRQHAARTAHHHYLNQAQHCE